jgi:hypothetical protein
LLWRRWVHLSVVDQVGLRAKLLPNLRRAVHRRRYAFRGVGIFDPRLLAPTVLVLLTYQGAIGIPVLFAEIEPVYATFGSVDQYVGELARRAVEISPGVYKGRRGRKEPRPES